MGYFKALGFEKEPFSTSPDPDFLFMSKEHESALTNTLIELSLKRGLSVVFGDIGMGKTTLSRKLIQELAKREKFLFQMILNPSFENEEQFLYAILENFGIAVPKKNQKNLLTHMRNTLERHLLDKTINEGKTVVIIIDEAQKLCETALETLRVLLNYETNTFKLIQIVLMGQLELYPKISRMDNLCDRISFQCTLNPLSLDDTRELIQFRLKAAGYKKRMKMFLEGAVQEIYRYTRGRPRRIIMTCHKAVKKMLMEKRYVVDEDMIKAIIAEEGRMGWRRRNFLLSNSY